MKRNIYDSISNEKRARLIQMVITDKEKLNVSARLLKMNYSTAKTIVRMFRKNKTILKKYQNKNEVKKKLFSIQTNVISGNNPSFEKKALGDSKLVNVIKLKKEIKKKLNLNFSNVINEINYYLNMRLCILAEISRNQRTLNLLGLRSDRLV